VSSCNQKAYYCVHNSLQRREEYEYKIFVIMPEGKKTLDVKVSNEGSCGVITDIEEIGCR
jgi:hypothetical protein